MSKNKAGATLQDLSTNNKNTGTVSCSECGFNAPMINGIFPPAFGYSNSCPNCNAGMGALTVTPHAIPNDTSVNTKKLPNPDT